MATNVVKDLRKCSGRPLSTGAPGTVTTEALAKLNERLLALEAASTTPSPVAAETVATIFHGASNCVHRVKIIGSDLPDRTLCNWFFDETEVCLFLDDKPSSRFCTTCFDEQVADSDSS